MIPCSWAVTCHVVAGADIKEMQPREFSEVYGGNFLGFWNSLAVFDKPLIAAVNGFAVSPCYPRFLTSGRETERI